jgi:hypothetical protein
MAVLCMKNNNIIMDTVLVFMVELLVYLFYGQNIMLYVRYFLIKLLQLINKYQNRSYLPTQPI